MSTNESSEIPPPAQAIIAAFEEPDGEILAVRITGDRVRLKYLARRLHALGPRPLFHYLNKVERGYPLREHLEATPVSILVSLRRWAPRTSARRSSSSREGGGHERAGSIRRLST